ncbi:unnamed protein product [Clonostachys rhizophaga]|uniref:Zn(2)-C6 fungal-type domain-containing protein n=1 Tax=Clonostachys rhizophaga TaxID=160324 RepID=A0A9N9VH64_9HYPO|nr:unnamed protein product [Clonostachys rhizophaga]
MDITKANARPACDTCRSRKTKCDRALPRCGRCVRVGQACGYAGPRYPSREELSGQLSQLQDRLTQAEAQISTPHLPKLAASYTPSPPLFHPEPPNAEHLDVRSSPRIQEDDYVPVDPNLMANLTPEPINVLSFTSSFPDGIDFFSTMSVDWPLEGPGNGLETALPASASPQTLLHFGGQEGTETRAETGQVSAQDLSILHQKYFSILFHAWPFQSRQRFEKELMFRPDWPPILALSHAIALYATTVSQTHQHLQQRCYKAARKYIEMSEMDDNESSLANLSLFQALIFVIRYEITSQPLTRAWMTLGRAIRLSKMLKLDKIDSYESKMTPVVDLEVRLPPPADAMELEERRRSFWSLYILESYASTRTGISCELGEAKSFQTRLPSPGPLDSSFVAIDMPYLGEVSAILPHALPPISPYTGCILMVELTLQCFQHATLRQAPSEGVSFWDNHYRLIKEFTQRASLLKAHLDTNAVKTDPISFSLHMNLCAAEIYLHEAAMKEILLQQLPHSMASESKKCSTAAAFRIANAVRLNWPSRGSQSDLLALQATFIAWPLVMAMRFLSQELASVEAKSISDGVAVSHSLRLLQAALDHVEKSDGYWHSLTRFVTPTLQRWDEKSAFDMNSL